MAFMPIMMKDAYLRLGDESTGPVVDVQTTSITLKPSAGVQRLKTLSPEGRFSDADDPEWELEVAYSHGENVAGGTTDTVLADYLLANHGQKLDFLFRPRNGGKGYAGVLTAIAGPIGGKQGAWMEGSVTLPVEGQPVAVAVGEDEGA